LNSHLFNQDAPSRLDVTLPENIFAHCNVAISQKILEKQQTIIHAIESVIALPFYQKQVLSYAPQTAHFLPKAKGVFFGYDFHLDENENLQLIEINTNAGGALLNALKFSPQTALQFLEMFQQEWQLSRGDLALKTIAIVDELPREQYLYPEFLLFQDLFEKNGIHALICAPQELRYQNEKLWFENTPIDLVYNRLTDFYFQENAQQALVKAYLAQNVVITPHPRTHALYANKRNLTLLSNEHFLQSLDIEEQTRQILLSGIAPTILVEAKNAECLWSGRKQLFFKPAKGFGSKAAYRGDKLTKRVFGEILAGDYVAQKFVPPHTQNLNVSGETQTFKIDLRAYVYDGNVQLSCARLYQGQTTNFRSVGGGFASLVKI
jgi:hypothetical protein